MLKRHKDFLRAVVTELRHALAGYSDGSGTWQRGDLDRELERLGISPDGTITSLDSLPNPSDAERRARYVADAQLASLQNSERIAARTELVERAAYSWINRLLALRVMEARGLIDETLRRNPEYSGVPEALYLLRLQAPDRATGADGGWWAVIEDACAARSATLPGLFDPRDPAVALRPSTPALLRCVALVGNALPGYTLEEADSAFADPDAIGWAYQFYQEEAKARTYAKFGSGGKAETRSEIASATQLFTERYMVQWLLQNSLGRFYHEAYPDSKLPDTWDYYIRRSDLDGNVPPSVKSLRNLTVMDPSMGSGHFLREAFDMLVAMYHEQEPELNAAHIADRILTHHLHGVDIDPRAAQLAALTLYLRAWELVREGQRAQRRLVPMDYRPPSMNLATSPTGLSAGALERHLRRHPEDQVFKPLLEGIFSALEKADLLGSLIQPSAQLDAAIAKLQQPHTIAMDFDADQSELRRTIADLAGRDPAGLKRMLLDRIAASFAAEVGSSDVGADLFGREAEQGVRLLELLDSRYAVVVTNPPYMGSKNMDPRLKQYVEQHFRPGKTDLYAAFMIRCFRLCLPTGRVAMVTQHGWMFTRAFLEFRALPEERLEDTNRDGGFTGLLRETSLEVLAHLGPGAFEEISGEVVQNAMFVLLAWPPRPKHHVAAFRLVNVKGPVGKAEALLNVHDLIVSNQQDYLSLPSASIMYWIIGRLVRLYEVYGRASQYLAVPRGLSTGENDRFIRYSWETTERGKRWSPFGGAGSVKKWWGLRQLVVDWPGGEFKMREMSGARIQNKPYFERNGATFSQAGAGRLAVRLMGGPRPFEAKSPGVFVVDGRHSLAAFVAYLNCRVASWLVRAFSPGIDINEAAVASLPVPGPETLRRLDPLGTACTAIGKYAVSFDPTEDNYSCRTDQDGDRDSAAALLSTLEAMSDTITLEGMGLEDIEPEIFADMGMPVGLFPLLADYDSLPNLPSELNGLPVPESLPAWLSSRARLHPDAAALREVRTKLRAAYEAGPSAKGAQPTMAGSGEDGSEGADDDVPSAKSAVSAVPFLEAIAARLRIHPISVCWLLEELRAEGVHCKPEERRLLEDRLSVLLLRLLGHRWPKQIEACEPLPAWADTHGIIPVTSSTGEPTAAERLRQRLRAEDGDVGAQRTEALLQELTGLPLEEWVRQQFFPRHVRQFKYRPIAWHLASSPQGGGGKRKGVRRLPAFECLVYYHACAGDVLARLRSHYLQPLILIEQRRAEEARRAGDETGAALAAERIGELEAFAAKLRQVDEEGFACPELDALVGAEPLDSWSGDGHHAPSDREELLRRERAWQVDTNDGVRVNIAPLQLAGVLAAEVLKAADARKAIADRARWRADERRWVREGKLPRCGWMDEDVPESPRWHELARQREAERRKLEEKRGAASERLL